MGAASEIEAGNGAADVAPSSFSDASGADLHDGAEAERNPIFDALVTPDDDVVGLVAYSLYKQNKRAWLDDFIKATGRAPSEAETRAYIIGESTERRLNTYRRLAAATLAEGPHPAAANGATGKSARSARPLLAAAGAVVAALAVLELAARAGYLPTLK
jgi:hypothetical protein